MDEWLEFLEPAPGLSEGGCEITVSRRIRVTVEDAIAQQRFVVRSVRPGYIASPEQLLNDFMVTHYAYRVEE